MGVLAASRVDAPAAAVSRSRGAEQGFEEIAVIRETAGAAGGFADHSDFFEALFGAAGAAHRGRRGIDPGRGEDTHAKVMLDLDAALKGGSRTFTLRIPEIDSAGRISAKERVLNVQVPKGI